MASEPKTKTRRKRKSTANKNTIRQDVWHAVVDTLSAHGMGEKIAKGLADRAVAKFSDRRREVSKSFTVPPEKDKAVRELLLARTLSIHNIAKQVGVGVSTVQRAKAELEGKGLSVGWQSTKTPA